jgi:hypothetical protein
MWANDDGFIHFPPEGNSIESSVEEGQDFHLFMEKHSPPIIIARIIIKVVKNIFLI